MHLSCGLVLLDSLLVTILFLTILFFLRPVFFVSLFLLRRFTLFHVVFLPSFLRCLSFCRFLGFCLHSTLVFHHLREACGFEEARFPEFLRS